MLNLDEIRGLWVTATKTRQMKVKHITAVLSDLQVSHAFLVRTLEGDEGIRADAFICVGFAGEMWQQSKQNLFSKYTLTDCDEEGWWLAVPKTGNAVDACKITPELTNGDTSFSVAAQWGTASDDGKFYQTGSVGDWILRNPINPDDVWIVKGSIFDSTYEIK